MKKVYIYKIINLINNKVYIGKSINPKKRFNKHLLLAEKGNMRHLYCAIRKYGKDNFKLEIIDSANEDEINDRERYWIAHYKSTDTANGYNHTFGGEGGDTWTLNPNKNEMSKKLSKSLKGRVVSQETREKISKAHSGKIITIENRQKISNTLKNKIQAGEFIPNTSGIGKGHPKGVFKHSEKTKKKMSEIQRGKSWEKRMGKDKADSLKLKMSKRMSGSNNPLYKNTPDYQVFIKELKSGLSVKDISNKYNCSYYLIYNRCGVKNANELYNKVFGKLTIRKFTKDMIFVDEFDSLVEAAISVGDAKYHGKIALCCRKKKLSAYGFIWRYYRNNKEVDNYL